MTSERASASATLVYVKAIERRFDNADRDDRRRVAVEVHDELERLEQSWQDSEDETGLDILDAIEDLLKRLYTEAFGFTLDPEYKPKHAKTGVTE